MHWGGDAPPTHGVTDHTHVWKSNLSGMIRSKLPIGLAASAVGATKVETRNQRSAHDGHEGLLHTALHFSMIPTGRPQAATNLNGIWTTSCLLMPQAPLTEVVMSSPR